MFEELVCFGVSFSDVRGSGGECRGGLRGLGGGRQGFEIDRGSIDNIIDIID